MTGFYKLLNFRIILLLFVLNMSRLGAQPLLVENFDYTPGTALSSVGWTAHSGAGTNPILVGAGLSFDGYSGSNIGGAAYVVNNGEDVHRTFQEVAGGSVYVAFLLKTEPTNAAGYFLHLGQQTIGTTYFSRVYVNATGDGIGLSGGSAPATFVPITPNVTHLVVLKHDLASKLSSMYVFTSMPTSEPSQPASSFTETLTYTGVGSIALRQYNANQRAVVDGIRVATTWNEAIGTGGTPNIPTLTVNPAALSGFSYVVGSGPSSTQTYTVSGTNLDGMGHIVLLAPTDYEISTNGSSFSSTISLPYGGGVITGQPVTIHVRLKAGLPIGTYNQQISHNGGGAVSVNLSLSGQVVSGVVPEISAEIVPQYIQGINGTNATRLPFAFWANLSNLTPNATYRYIHQVVTTADGPTVNGAGNPIFVTATGNFVRTTSPNLGNEGAYGTFTTNALGSYSGWFMVEPTGNSRFTPGNEVFFRIRLNDGNEGTQPVTYLTTSTFAKVINFGTEASASQGTGIRALSPSAAKNFVLLYDNTDGTGRPIYGTSVETTGVDFQATTTWAQFYRDHVAGMDGSWGGILPNLLPNGIRRIEERAKTGGNIVQAFTSASGEWSGVNTVNPAGGIDNILVINLNTTNTPVLTVNPTTLSGFSYIEGQGPSQAQTYTITGEYLEGSGNISVVAPAAYEISLNGTNYSQSLNLPFAGGIITGQPVSISVRLKAGLAVGTYNNQTITHNGGGAAEKTVSLNGEVISAVQPEISAEIVPQYIQGINGTNATRLPFAFWATLSNLTPNATYRYIHQVVTTADGPTVNGAGNPIFVTATGNFVRTTSPNLGNEGAYGTFTTNAQGSYSGWFMVEPTGNSRFTPGNEVFFRIRLNDGNEGTQPVTYLTTSTFAKVINFGTEASASQGTGIRALSPSAAKNFVLLYDNTDGTGRPIYGTSVETTGVDFQATTTWAQFYRDHVAGMDGSWGGILPNLLPNGIRRIEERSKTGGNIVQTFTSASGEWSGVNTVNPAGGIDNILVINLNTTNTPVLAVNPTTLSGFSYIEGQGPSQAQTYTITGEFLEGSGNINVTAPAAYEISLNGTNYSQSLNLPFAGGIITGQPVSISVRLKAGLAVGTYNNQTITHNGGGAAEKTVSLNGEVSSGITPGIEAAVAPRYMQGLSPTNNTRVPSAWWIKIENLTPGSTYRFINQAVISTDLPSAGGAGNPIYVSAQGNFSRSTSPSLATEGGYGTFTANAQGKYEGWFVLEPTGNSRFTTGNEVFLRIRINDGNNGTTAVHYLTVADPTKVIDFGDNILPNEGSSIRALSTDPARSFVSLYDNTNGTGQPLSITHVEASGIDFAALTSYAPFYRDHVSGVNGSWGTIIPNQNPQGVRLIKVQNPFTGYVKEYASDNGVWGTVDTRNPDNGLLTTLVLNLTTIGLNETALQTLKVFADRQSITLLETGLTQGKLLVHNTMGQLLLIKEIAQTGSRISHNLPAGSYIISIQSPEKSARTMVIIR
ncbi:MAG: T9SS type A sorting domain-containing protein [Bacteroidetes bacterium]|nr:T9SS type A sorting domain-containing protein [Bacteroidota bacterium]